MMNQRERENRDNSDHRKKKNDRKKKKMKQKCRGYRPDTRVYNKERAEKGLACMSDCLYALDSLYLARHQLQSRRKSKTPTATHTHTPTPTPKAREEREERKL
jgi:hypothetical protein